MKIEIEEKQPVFVPIKIEVTLETVDEAEEFAMVINPGDWDISVEVCEMLKDLREKIKNSLKEREGL